jgi:hypothetical protein
MATRAASRRRAARVAMVRGGRTAGAEMLADLKERRWLWRTGGELAPPCVAVFSRGRDGRRAGRAESLARKRGQSLLDAEAM